MKTFIIRGLRTVIERAKALDMLSQIHERAAITGRNRIGMREIDAEIDAARRVAAPRKRRARPA